MYDSVHGKSFVLLWMTTCATFIYRVCIVLMHKMISHCLGNIGNRDVGNKYVQWLSSVYHSIAFAILPACMSGLKTLWDRSLFGHMCRGSNRTACSSQSASNTLLSLKHCTDGLYCEEKHAEKQWEQKGHKAESQANAGKTMLYAWDLFIPVTVYALLLYYVVLYVTGRKN